MNLKMPQRSVKRHSRTLVRLAVALASLALVLSVAQQARAAFFTNTGTMTGARAGHTATLLRYGYVLVTGGYNGTDRLKRTESK